ncbi:MAG: nucleotidyltransferase domain-containing protein [Thermodesulfobacteriota bacterium]
MTPKEKSILESLRQKLLEANIPLLDLILFGSRARGDAGPDSDFDVLVIVKERNLNMRKTISDCAWEAGFESEVVIQSIVRTKTEVEEGPEKYSPLFQTIRQEGIHV